MTKRRFSTDDCSVLFPSQSTTSCLTSTIFMDVRHFSCHTRIEMDEQLLSWFTIIADAGRTCVERLFDAPSWFDRRIRCNTRIQAETSSVCIQIDNEHRSLLGEALPLRAVDVESDVASELLVELPTTNWCRISFVFGDTSCCCCCCIFPREWISTAYSFDDAWNLTEPTTGICECTWSSMHRLLYGIGSLDCCCLRQMVVYMDTIALIHRWIGSRGFSRLNERRCLGWVDRRSRLYLSVRRS